MHSEHTVESLEARRLLAASVTLDDDQLIIIGNQKSSNTVTVRYTRDGDDIIAVVNGKTYAFDKNDVKEVRIFGGDRHDDLRILTTNRNPFDRDVTIRGGAGDDTLVGSTEPDLITGDLGNDTIVGGPEDDDFKSSDTVYGGNGNDTITIDTDSTLVFCGRGNDVVTGQVEHGYVWGNDGNDVFNLPGDQLILLGNAGNDTITGAGHDTIYGGGGADVLKGGDERTLGEIKFADKLSLALQVRIPTLADPSR